MLNYKHLFLIEARWGRKRRKHSSEIYCLLSLLFLFAGNDARYPSWHCMRACHSIKKKQPTSSLRRFHLRQLNFHQFPPSANSQHFKGQLRHFYTRTPAILPHSAGSSHITHTLFCADPFQWKVSCRGVRVRYYSHRKFITGCELSLRLLLCCSYGFGVLCLRLIFVSALSLLLLLGWWAQTDAQ